MSGTLTIQSLGGLQVRLDSTAVSGFASRKAEALLVYLVCYPRPHARDVLATLLWDETTQQRALGNLSVLLSSLRKQLAPFLISSRHDIGINPQATVQIDANEFVTQLTAVRRQYPVVQPMTNKVAAQLTAATSLYQGDFLAGFHVRQATGFEEWLLMERERLQRLAIEAIDTLVSYQLAAGQYADGISQATRLIALDSLREQSYCQMMRLLAYSGQRHEAMAHYETCRRTLKAELGIEPSAVTQALFAEIKADGLAVEQVTTPVPAMPNHLPLHNLPVESTPFVGRYAELTHIHERLQNPECRLLTLVGPGGIGKTRLAVQAAVPRLGDYLHGVWFVPMAKLNDKDALVVAVAEMIGFSFGGTAVPQIQLLNYLRQKQMLLILDNFEHLLDEGVDLPLAILDQAPDVQLLVTSRERLNIGAEWLLTIDGLSYPRTPSQKEVKNGSFSTHEQYSAIDLFVNSARQVKPDFTLVDGDETAVTEICQLVEGMPLGIKLAAAWIEVLTPGEIAAEIRQTIDFLETNQRDLPDRQRSIRAIYDASWFYLSKREQSVFPQLSVFRGGFTYKAVQQIIGATLADLKGFINKSLLQRQENGRYDMHELLRQYAAEYLAQTADIETAVYAQHAIYYSNAVHQRHRALYGPDQQVTAADIEHDFENARTAWLWAIDSNRYDLLHQMADVLGIFLQWNGRYGDGITLCKTATDRWLHKSAPYAADPIIEKHGWLTLCKLLTWQANFNFIRTHYQEANGQSEYILTLLDHPTMSAIDSRFERATINMVYGAQLIESEDQHTRGLLLLQQAHSLFEALDNELGIARSLTFLTAAYWQQGEYAKATELILEAISIHQLVGNMRGLGQATMMRGVLMMYSGELEQSELLLQESLTQLRQTNDQYDIGINLNNLGVCRMFSGTFSLAAEAWEEAKQIALTLGSRDEFAHYETNLGLTKMFDGQYEAAGTHAEYCFHLAQEIGYSRVLGTGRILLGGLQMANGDWETAYQTLMEAEAIYRRIVQYEELAMVLGMKSLAARELGKEKRARQACSEGIGLIEQIGAFGPQIFVLLVWAQLFADLQMIDDCLLLFAVAWKRPFVHKSRWFADVITNKLDAIQLQSAPERTQAAQIQSASIPTEQIIQQLAKKWRKKS